MSLTSFRNARLILPDIASAAARMGNGFFMMALSVATSTESRLASSAAGMDRMVRTMVRTMARATRAPLSEVVRMASLTPAERAGIAADSGSLEVGKRADILLLAARLQVKRVFIAGGELL